MADIQRTAETTLIVTAEGAAQGAAVFERAMERVKTANQAAVRATERSNKALEAVGAASGRAAKAQASLASAQARAAQVAAQTGASADKVVKANEAVAKAEERVRKATEAVAAAQVRAGQASQAAAAAAEKVAKAEEMAALGAERHQVRIGDQAKKLEALRRQLDPAYDATIKLAQAEEFLQSQLDAGKIGAQEHAGLLEKLKEKYDDTGAGAEGAAKSTGAASQTLKNLSYQFSDTVASLGSGAGIMQVVIQQGPQVADAFGGIPEILGKIPPSVRVAAGALVAVGVAAAVVASKMSQVSTETRRLEALAGGLNPKLKGMSAELRELTDAMVARGATREQAVEAMETLARIQGLNPKFLKDISGLSVDLAALYGGDPADWARKLAEAAQKGAAGMRELDKEIGFLGAEELRELDRQDRLGHRTELLRAAFDALTKQVGGKGREMASEWANAFHDMGVAFDGLVEKIGKTSFFQGFKEQALAELAAITALMTADYWKNPGKYTPALPQTAPAAPPAPSPGAGRSTPSTDARIAQLNDLTQQMKSLRDQTNAATAEAVRLGEAGEKIGAVAATKEEIDAAWVRAGELEAQYKEVEAQFDKLRKEMGARPKKTLETLPPEPRDNRGLTDDQKKEVDPKWERYKRETAAMKENQVQRAILLAGIAAYDAAIERGADAAVATQEKLIAEATARRDLTTAIRDQSSAAELDIRSTLAMADAYGVSTEAGLKAEAMAQALAEAQTTGANASERASQILRKNAAEGYKTAIQDLDRLKADNDNRRRILGGAQKGPVAEEEAKRGAEAESAYRDRFAAAQAARDAATTAAGRAAADAQIADLMRLRTEYQENLKQRDDGERAIASAAMYRQSYQDDLETLETEAKLIGATVEQRERELAAIKAKQALLAMGYDRDSAAYQTELKRLTDIIEKREKVALKTRLETEAHERNKAAALDSINIVQDGLDDWIHEGNQFIDVIRNMSKAFLRLGEDVLIMAPLKRWLTEMMDSSFASRNGSSGAMTAGQNIAPAGGGWATTVSSMIQTGLNMWAGWSAGTGPSQMPNAASDPGALSGGALLENYKMFPVAHQGWHVGHEPPPQVRMAPTSVFVGAPRLHSGGMRPGEYGAILERGEEVLTSRNPRHRRNFQGSGHTVVMNITTPDANSFRQSQGQVTAAAARSLQMAARRNG